MSKIEWTEKTWNPVTGCTKISPGCKYCYAETMSKRLHAMGAKGYEKKFTEISLHEDRLDIPLRRKKPTTFFVCSMSDLFHPNVPVDFIDKVMHVIAKTPQHTYQILTKRPERMMNIFLSYFELPKNLWVGTSVENKKHGVPRIDSLRKIKTAAIRFLSVEPLLEDIGKIDLTNIDWVIVGGESGHKARPMRPEWAESVQKQCQGQGVKFFFKQWGTHGEDGVRRNKKQNGRELFGKIYDEMPMAVA